MKTYDQAPPETVERVAALIARYHPDLQRVQLRVDLLMASTDAEDGDAVTCGGYPAYAVVRILGSKDRAMNRGDAEIVIDRDEYEAMSAAQRDALLDHELYHLELKRDKGGKPKMDDHQRPCLKMRKHDRQFGWFDEVARRHRENSIEVKQATQLREEAGQTYLAFETVPAAPSSEATNVTITSADKVVFTGTARDLEPTEDQLRDATSIAQKEGFISRSMIQRTLHLGYNRASAIVDKLLSLGVVGPESDNGHFNFTNGGAQQSAAA